MDPLARGRTLGKSRVERPRVCHFGAFPVSEAYSRNICVARALAAGGWEVVECRASNSGSPWRRAKSCARPLAMVGALCRLARDWFALAIKHLRAPRYDVLLVGYPSHVDVFLAAALAKWRRRPVVMDAFIGLYDTVVRDRGLVRERSLLARVVRAWEWVALHLADSVMVDTEEQADLLAREYGLSRSRVFAAPVGIDERVWGPTPLPDRQEEFRIAFWSTFIPLHGVSVVAQAAAILDSTGEAVRFEVVGDGQTAPEFAAALDELKPRNIVWRRGFTCMAEIVKLAAHAHCCLGIMGTSGKASRVVPYKVYQALAAARPVITADTAAARRVLTDGESALLVPPGDPAALARAIARLARDWKLCNRLACEGRMAYEKCLSEDRLRETLDSELRRVLARVHGGGRQNGPAAGASACGQAREEDTAGGL